MLLIGGLITGVVALEPAGTAPRTAAHFPPKGGEGGGGEKGETGLSVLNGSGSPSSGTGRVGEFYIDTTAHAIWGPKLSSTWSGTGPTSLLGPTGPPGSTGATGPQGPQGIQGTAGAEGKEGKAGPEGPQGVKGLTGAEGPKGATGEKGENGLPGATGAQGPAGPAGKLEIGAVVEPLKERAQNTLFECSGASACLVYLTISSKPELTVYKIEIEAETIIEANYTGKVASEKRPFTFVLAAGKKWKVPTTATITEIKSTYQVLS